MRALFNLDRLLAAGGKIGTISPTNTTPCVQMKGGLQVRISDSGDPYMDLAGDMLLGVRIPAHLDRDLIEGFTAYENVSTARRRIGEYQFKSARCLLSPHSSPQFAYHIKYTGKTIEDIAELHRRICEGLIWPVGDYEKEMVPPPFRHFRDVLRELWQIIRRDLSLTSRRA